MTEFQDVIDRWATADVSHIHPLRRVNEDDYWSSGVSQATDATEWLPEGCTVLDFGCGDGRLSVPLALLGYEVIAADASLDMLERVRANAAEQDIEVTTVLSNGLDAFERIGMQVDGIVCRAVLIHHAHADGAEMVKSLARLLVPGGYFIADWPVGTPHERRDWIDVTVWSKMHRLEAARAAGLELVADDTPSVWRKV